MKRDSKKKIKIIFEYIVDFDNLDTERILEEMRGYGEANIIDVSIINEGEDES